MPNADFVYTEFFGNIFFLVLDFFSHNCISKLSEISALSFMQASSKAELWQ